MAFTVAFFVKPPTLPDTRDTVNGKLPLYPPASTVPTNRAHLFSAATYRTMAAPATPTT